MRAARPAILAVMLVGTVLALVLMPSTLQAQQGPPGQLPDTGYGAAPSKGRTPPREIGLLGRRASSAADVSLVVGVVVAVAIVGGATLLVRRRS